MLSVIVVKPCNQTWTSNASAASACLWRSILEGMSSLSSACFRALESMWLSAFAPVGFPVFMER